MAEKPDVFDLRRAKAIKYAFWAGKLLEPKYFDVASKAIAEKDKEALLRVFKEAGIPKNLVTEMRADYASDWGWGWGS